jgi:hypothetical protein
MREAVIRGKVASEEASCCLIAISLYALLSCHERLFLRE